MRRQLPFVTPGLSLRFDGAKDGGVEFTYETDSDKPLTIRGAVSPARAGTVTMRRAYESSKSYTARIGPDGHFVLPTQRLRKIANNTFLLSFDVPPSAPRKAYFSALCLDCLAGGPNHPRPPAAEPATEKRLSRRVGGVIPDTCRARSGAEHDTAQP